MNLKIAVIGSGVAGMAAAVRLAFSGHHVEVFEANDSPGGKLSELKIGKYRFDAGPSLFTLPTLVDELFELTGENPRDFFSYEKLPINCQYFYPDGTIIKAYSDKELLVQEIANKTCEPEENIVRAINNSRNLYECLSDLFMFSALQDPKTYFSKKAFNAYRNIYRLGFFNTMNGANKRLFQQEKNVQLFNRYATYNGSSPYEAPATMNIIPHLEMSVGAFFPKGGMYSITKSIYGLARRLGVQFHFNSTVSAIEVKKNKITGLNVGSDFLPFDRVVSNMDVVNTYKKLMPDIKAPKFLLNQPKSSSALIFYWGIKRKFGELDLHNIFFSADYREEFEHIFKTGGICEDPTVYINITSKYNSSDAPSYGENWFTMINVPNNQGQDWDKLIGMARQNIINKLSQKLGTDISGLIEEEEVLGPRSIESKTSSAQGALYGNSSNNLFAAFLRHANVSRRVNGLYFCGGSVHPGGGIPMCLSSAKLVAKYFH